MAHFDRYVGIDYSGAGTPTSSLSALRVYSADCLTPPQENVPPPGQRKYWTRKGVAEWLVTELSGSRPTLIGIDHGFSFPMRYFEKHRLPLDWPRFLDDFQQHWPTDADTSYVCFLRDGLHGNGAERTGDSKWLRLTEQWTTSAKSVFQFDVQGQVANSTHAGLPWLRWIRQRCGERVHFWPLDGWEIPAGRSVVAEVYPSMWAKRFPVEGRNADQHSAYAVAAWLQRADSNGSLPRFFSPPLEPKERELARIEGWILGVV